jgi:uncharacterized protein (DUF1778 family)
MSNFSVIKLTPEESEKFFAAILNPPKPSEAIKEAVRSGVKMARVLDRDGVVRVELGARA